MKKYIFLFSVFIGVIMYMKSCTPTIITIDFNKAVQEEIIIPKYATTSRLTLLIKGEIDGVVTIFTGVTEWNNNSKIKNTNYSKLCKLTKGTIDTTLRKDWYYHPGRIKIISDNCSDNSKLKIKYVFFHTFL